jgi:hypothetical protein
MKGIQSLVIFLLFFFFSLIGSAQAQIEEVGKTMEEYILENHVDKIESMIHKLATSKSFLDQFLLSEREINAESVDIKRKDVKIGSDLDVYVKHFTEHQNFTMILVPISIYSLAVYDTILFSVIEVSDAWLHREFPYDDISNDSIKSSLLSFKNHSLLAEHVYGQAMTDMHAQMGEVSIDLVESFVSTNTIHEALDHLDALEQEKMKVHYGLLKRAFRHSVDLNVELNIYVFGFDDLEVHCTNKRGETTFRVSPSNIFTRHHFEE